MSLPIISATKFFAENGLFKLLKHTDGELKKSYKTLSQEYTMECNKCGEQVEQRGNSAFTCRRCRRSVVAVIDDGVVAWVIKNPEGTVQKKNAEAGMKRAPKIIIIQDEVDPFADSGEEDEVEEVKPKMPEPKEMVSFLKKTALKTSGERIPVKKAAAKAVKMIQETEDINESDEDYVTTTTTTAIPVKKGRPPKPKAEPKEECVGPAVEEKTMKIMRLKPGQCFYCKITGVMYMGDSE